MLKLILIISVLFMMILDLLGVSGATKSAKMKLIWRSTKKHTVQGFLALMGSVLRIRMEHGTRDAIELCKQF